MNFLNRIASDVQLLLRRPARQQYAALCYRSGEGDGPEVLLITSRDTGRWVIPKGWPMDGRLGHEVALQEAYEEAGVKGEVDEVPLGTYAYKKRLKGGVEVPCQVQVYAVEVEALLDAYPEAGQRRLEWMSCKDAAPQVDEPQLSDILGHFPDEFRARKLLSSKKTHQD